MQRSTSSRWNKDNAMFHSVRKIQRDDAVYRKYSSVMEQGHLELHRMINVLVQNSIQWHIAQIY